MAKNEFDKLGEKIRRFKEVELPKGKRAYASKLLNIVSEAIRNQLVLANAEQLGFKNQLRNLISAYCAGIYYEGELVAYYIAADQHTADWRARVGWPKGNGHDAAMSFIRRSKPATKRKNLYSVIIGLPVPYALALESIIGEGKLLGNIINDVLSKVPNTQTRRFTLGMGKYQDSNL